MQLNSELREKQYLTFTCNRQRDNWHYNGVLGNGLWERLVRINFYAKNGVGGLFSVIDEAIMLEQGYSEDDIESARLRSIKNLEIVWVLQDWHYYFIDRALLISEESIKATYKPDSANIMINFYLPMLLDNGLLLEVSPGRFVPNSYAYDKFINYANYHKSNALEAAIANGDVNITSEKGLLAKGRDWLATLKREEAKIKKLASAVA